MEKEVLKIHPSWDILLLFWVSVSVVAVFLSIMMVNSISDFSSGFVLSGAVSLEIFITFLFWFYRSHTYFAVYPDRVVFSSIIERRKDFQIRDIESVGKSRIEGGFLGYGLLGVWAFPPLKIQLKNGEAHLVTMYTHENELDKVIALILARIKQGLT